MGISQIASVSQALVVIVNLRAVTLALVIAFVRSVAGWFRVSSNCFSVIPGTYSTYARIGCL
jgi:hypothetical protein